MMERHDALRRLVQAEQQVDKLLEAHEELLQMCSDLQAKQQQPAP